MALNRTERMAGDSDVENLDLFSGDDLGEFDSELDDGANAVWPSGEFFQEALPPAPGRCRRVPHDW